MKTRLSLFCVLASLACYSSASWGAQTAAFKWVQHVASTTFGTEFLAPHGAWNMFLAKVGFAPLHLEIDWNNSQAQLHVTGENGTRYVLERVQDLSEINLWQTVLTDTLVTGSQVRTDPTSGAASRRFYRVRLVP